MSPRPILLQIRHTRFLFPVARPRPSEYISAAPDAGAVREPGGTSSFRGGMIVIRQQEREELTLPDPCARFARFFASAAEASGSAARLSRFPCGPLTQTDPELSVEGEGG